MTFEDENHQWHYYEEVDIADQQALDEGIKELRAPLLFAIGYFIYVFSTF
jgi:hypothetical protein